MYSVVDSGERCDQAGSRRAPWSALEPLRPCVPSIADSGACRSGPRRACRGRCRRDWTTRVGPDTAAFVERLLEREKTDREQRRYQRLKGHARLHLDATIEDLNFKAPRGIDRSLVLRLSPPGSGSGTARPLSSPAPPGRENPISPVRSATRPAASGSPPATTASPGSLTSSPSPVGTGRIPSSSSGSQGRGCSSSMTGASLRSQARGRHDLLEVLDDRYARRGTLLASQVPVEHWHDVVGDPTFGDAILDPQPRPPAPLWTSAPPR